MQRMPSLQIPTKHIKLYFDYEWRIEVFICSTITQMQTVRASKNNDYVKLFQM